PSSRPLRRWARCTFPTRRSSDLFAEVIRDNSAQTLMPSIVDKKLLERANGRLWGAETVMNTFIGPPLAGALIAVALAVPFLINADRKSTRLNSSHVRSSYAVFCL